MARPLFPLLVTAALLSPAIGRAQPTDLQTYAIFAAGEAKLGSSVVVGSGNIGSNLGDVVIGGQSQVLGEVAGAVIKLRRGAAAVGDLWFDTLQRASGTAIGASHSPLTQPILSFPAPPVVTGLTRPPVEVGQFSQTFLNSTGGGFTSITSKSDATIVFLGGTYNVGELVMRGRRGAIRCAEGQTCIVNVLTKLQLGADRINVPSSGPPAGTLVFNFAGTTTVKVGNSGAMVKADFVAPLAKVKLSSSRAKPTTMSGRLVGATVSVAGHAVAGLSGGAAPTCGDGIVNQAGEQCDPPSDAACPGLCLGCTCSVPGGTPVLHSVGPSVVHNASAFGLQAFGEGFAAGAKLEILDKTTNALLVTLDANVVSARELTALLPAGLPVPTGISRELTAKVLNPGGLRSGTPDIGHCANDTPTSPIACTRPADCPAGTGACLNGDQKLTLFNDAVFLNPNSAAVVPAPHGLCDDGTRCQSAPTCSGIGSGLCSPKLYVTPQQRDELWVFNTGTRQFVDQNAGASGVQGIPVADNPFHVEVLDAGGGVSRAWVVNRFDDSVSIIDTATDTELTRVTGTALGGAGRLRMETEIEFNRAGTRAYLSNENLDEVQVLDISGANRDAPFLVATVNVGVNPRGMVTNAADTRLYVANVQSANVSVIDIAPGSPTENQVVHTIKTLATDNVVGGRMDGWEAFVISGRAPRGIAVSDARNRIFVTSIGPQTGPRGGVSQVGGVIINPTITVIDGATDAVVAHVALNGVDPDRFTCSDPELMVVDDPRNRLYVTCQGSGTVDVLDTVALAAGLPAELAMRDLPLPTDATVPTLALNPSTGGFGNKTCAGFNSNAGTACTTETDCGCAAVPSPIATPCCTVNNPIGLHNGPRGLALSADRNRLFVVNQFTTSVATLDVSAGSAGAAFVVGTTSFPGAFGSDTEQRDRRLGQIEFFTDLKHTNISCATCHIDDHQDGVFFEADIAGPRLRRALSVRNTRDTPPLLQDQLMPDLGAFTDIVVHLERGGNVCTPCTELNGVFTCVPAPEGTCTLTSNSENQQNTLYAKAITFFPNPNLNADGSLSTTVPLPGGGTGDALRGEQIFDQLACATCHPEPVFTLDQFRVFNLAGFSSVQARRMREVGTPVNLPLRAKCQDSSRPVGVDGSTGFGVPTLRGIWDTFPLLMSGSAGLQVVGTEPVFAPGCTSGPGAGFCCSQLQSPLNPTGIPVPEQHLDVSTKDAIRALLTAPLAVPGTGHGAALGLSPGDLDGLIAYLRSL